MSAPIKLGHDNKLLSTDGAPAAGWVENLRVVGDRLLGDLVKVPDAIAQMMKAGRLRKRSIEARRNFRVGGRSYPLVLTGLALLGAFLPAVDSLADVAKLFARGPTKG